MGQKIGQDQLWVGVERMARFGRWRESEPPKAGKRYHPSQCSSILLSVLDQPIQCHVDVHLVLGRNAVAAYLTALDALQIHGINQVLHFESVGQIVLVSKDQEWNSSQRRLAQELMQLRCRSTEAVRVRTVHHKYDRVDPPAVSFPHGPEAGLAADVPQLNGHITFRHLAGIEPNGGDGILLNLVLAFRDHIQ